MTYIERRVWCSCSSNSNTIAEKSIKPCPKSSSSTVTSSLISSDSDSDPISDDSILSSLRSFGERRNTFKFITRSTMGSSNDYHTKRRIEELHERMDEIQISSFLKFINYHLTLKTNKKNGQINDLSKDLSSGHILIDLIEILSSTTLKREHGRTRFHSLVNVQHVLDYLKLRMNHIDITADEIVSGNRKQILALLWMIMKVFDFPSFRITNKNCLLEKTLLGFGQDRSLIVHWLNNILNHSLNTHEIHVKDFYIKTWIDGYYLTIILKYLIPLSLKYLTIKCFDYLQELNDLTPYDKRRLHLCLTISNYCFDTITYVDYSDKTEKCLFKYFTELQQNIFILIKKNHIGQLIQNNPYAKQVLDTAVQTRTEHSTHEIIKNEDYLTIIENDNQPVLKEEHKNAESHLTPSFNETDESSDKSIVEETRYLHEEQQQQDKLMHEKFCEEMKELESNSNMLNIPHDITKEEQIEKILDQSQIWNDITETSEQVANTNNEENPENIIINVDDKSVKFINDVQEWEQFVISNDEDEQTQDNHQQVEQVTSSENDIEQSIILNQDAEQTINKDVEILSEDLKQSKNEIHEHDIELNEPEEEEQETERPVENESCVTTSDQSADIVEEHIQQVNIEPEQLVEDISSSEIDESSIITSVNEEPIVIHVVETNHSIITNDEVESTTTIQSTKSELFNEQSIPDTTDIVNNENIVLPNGHNEQSEINNDEETNQSSTFIDNIESTECLSSNNEHEQIVTTNFNNDWIETNANLQQFTIESPVQIEASSVEHQSVNVTSKKLEKPIVMELPQPISLNGDSNTSMSNDQDLNAVNKKEPVENIVSSCENRLSAASNEQLTQAKLVSHQQELLTFVPKQQRSTSSSSSQSTSYSDVVSRQLPTLTNAPRKPTNPVKNQEYHTETQRKVITPQVKPEKPKQNNKKTEQVTLTSTIREPQSSVVLVEKQEAINTVIEEKHTTSNPSNGEHQTLSTVTNKCKRSHGRKRKAKKSSITNEYTAEPIVNNKQEEKEEDQEEDTRTSLSSRNQDIVSSKEQTSNFESVVEILSQTPNKPSNDDASPKGGKARNSSALTSRKSKKQTKSTTSSVEKSSSSSSIIPKPAVRADQKASTIIIESIYSRKTLGCACVFILICFCFVILIISIAYQ